MADLPHTYTDFDDDQLAAAGDTGHRVVSEDWRIAEATMERYEAALSMRERAARAAVDSSARVLPNAGDRIRALPLLPDGDDTAAHRVYSRHDLDVLERAAMASAASSMRERAVQAARESDEHPAYELSPRTAAVAKIRALPLLPDDEVAHSGYSQPANETPSEQPDFRAHLVAELLNATVDDAAEELADDPTSTWARAYDAWTTHRRDAANRTNTRYEERLAALEGLTRSIADLVEGHGVDIAQAQLAIRGLARRPLTADTDH